MCIPYGLLSTDVQPTDIGRQMIEACRIIARRFGRPASLEMSGSARIEIVYDATMDHYETVYIGHALDFHDPMEIPKLEVPDGCDIYVASAVIENDSGFHAPRATCFFYAPSGSPERIADAYAAGMRAACEAARWTVPMVRITPEDEAAAF